MTKEESKTIKKIIYALKNEVGKREARYDPSGEIDELIAKIINCDYIHKEDVKKVIRDYAIAAISKGRHKLDAVDDVVNIIARIDDLRASSEERCTIAPPRKASVWSALMRTFLGGK